MDTEQELNELKNKVAQIDRRLKELEMRGAGSVHEAVAALDTSVGRRLTKLEKDITRLENWIKNMRTP